jgi:hypothetical protein
MTKVMKKFLFYVFMWVLATHALSAQKVLPPSVQPYASKWQHSIVKNLQRIGYQIPDMHNGAGKSIGVNDRSAFLQLDSTKTFYAYDVPFPGDSTPLFRSKFRYEPLNTKIEENNQFENGIWLPLNRITVLSDDLGRDVEISAEIYDVNTKDFSPESRLLVYPRGNSDTLVDSVFTYGWNAQAQQWVAIFIMLNQYGPNDRLLESRSLLDVFGQPVWFKDKYTYDANGDNVKIESYGLLDGFEILTSKLEIKYDKNQPVETVAFIVDENGEFAPQSRITRTFVMGNREKQVNSYEWNLENNDWFQTEGITYDYDNERRVIQKETIIYHKEDPEERERLTYAYKQGENLALESSFIWLDNDFILWDRKYYYYRGAASVKGNQGNLPLSLVPNPTLGHTQIQLDEPAVIKIYNTHGDLISSGLYQPNTTLLLHDLPVGLYYITARTEKEMFSGRLVKM